MELRCRCASIIQAWLAATILAIIPLYTTGQAADELEEVIVSGSRLSGQVNTYTLELDPLSSESLVSQLDRSPMLQVNRNAGAGSLQEIYLRGADANYSMVLLNGVPLNDGTNSRGGVADISGINTLMLNQLEIASGAYSSIYGSEAVAGVIHLQSELAEPGHILRYQIDSERGHQLALRSNFEQGFMAYSRQDTPEFYRGSQYDGQSIMAQFQPDMVDRSLLLNGWFSEAKTSSFPDDSGGAAYAINRVLEERDLSQFHLSAQYVQPLGDGRLHASAYVKNKDEFIGTPAIAPGVRDPMGLPKVNSDNDLKQYQLSTYYQYESSRFGYLLGMDYKKEVGESEGDIDFGFFSLPARFSERRRTAGIFAELSMKLSEDWSWQITARGDDMDSDNVFTASSQLNFRFRPDKQFYLAWGKGFKTPSFYALSNPLVGDPDLKNERSRTQELGYKSQASYGEWQLSAYRYRFTNLVDFDPGPPPRLVNRNKVESKGIELSFSSLPASHNWQGQLAYSYNDTKTAGGNELLGRADNSLAASIEKRWPSAQLIWKSRIHYRDKSLSSSIASGQVILDGNTDISTSLSLKLSQHIGLEFGIGNLIDQDLEYTVGNQHSGTYSWLATTIGL